MPGAIAAERGAGAARRTSVAWSFSPLEEMVKSTTSPAGLGSPRKIHKKSLNVFKCINTLDQ